MPRREKMKRIFSLWIGLIILITSAPAWAVTGNFTNPEDSYVRETSPTTNYGSETVLIADGVSQDPGNGTYGEVATVIKWDLLTLGDSVTVTGVSVILNFTDASSGPYNIYSQNTSWSEGTVAWNDLDSGTDVLGTIAPFTFGEETVPLNADGVALVQGWIDGSIPNNGLAIRSGGTNNGIDMEAKEAGGIIPTLRVTYDNPASNLEQRVAYLENLLSNVTKEGNEMFFDGVNINIRNGLGATNGYAPDIGDVTPENTNVNGLGNLVIGYNETDNSGEVPTRDKSGSHNLVIGLGHNYTSFGGVIAGRTNQVTNPYSGVTGGNLNIASGLYSNVSGGTQNTASGPVSSILGGVVNTASDIGDSVSGGSHNVASGKWSSVGGGRGNTAMGLYSNVSGGTNNTANGQYSTVGGGASRTAAGEDDWVAGSLFEDN